MLPQYKLGHAKSTPMSKPQKKPQSSNMTRVFLIWRLFRVQTNATKSSSI